MNKFVGVAILSAIVAIATVFALRSSGALDGMGVNTGPGGGTGPVILEGDDDRPPVVVSGGSVFVEQQHDAKDYERGAFIPVTDSDKKKWIAWHEKGKKPKTLSVIVNNSTTATTECGPKWVHRGVGTLTFYFTPKIAGVESFTAQLVADAKNESELQFHFPAEAKQVTNEEFRLELQGVTLTKVHVDARPCVLGPKGRVEIRQRKP